MRCHYCSDLALPGHALCAKCLSEKAPAHMREQAGRSSIGGFIPNQQKLLSYIIPALALIILIYVSLFGLPLPKGSLAGVTARSNNSANAQPCGHSQACLVVYVAPWCPACQGELQMINTIADKLRYTRDASFQVIVGAAEPASIYEMARKIKAETFYDLDGKLGRALRVHAYPSWYVVDSNKKVALHATRRYFAGESDEHNAEYFLKNETGSYSKIFAPSRD